MLSSDHKQAEILDRTLAIGQAVQVHIHENPKLVYQLIVEAVCEATGANCAVLYPYQPSFGEFYDVDNVAAIGLHHELPVERRVDKRKGLAARVHQQAEIICEDIERDEPHLPGESSFITREGIHAFMGLSLRVGDDILGILYVDYREPHLFSEGEKRIIRLFGQQAAVAVSNSWTFRLAGTRADAISKLKTIGEAITAIEGSSKSLESLLKGIARSALDVLEADIVDVYQYSQARSEFLLPPALVGERWHPHIPKNKIYDDDVVMRLVRIGEPTYFHDAQGASLLTGSFEVPRDDAPEQRFVVREGVASSAMIPLKAAGETVGVMFVNHRTPQLFGREHRDVIETFAAQAAVAIHNARLFRQASDRAQALTELNELASQLVSIKESPQDTRGQLEQVAKRAQEVLGADLVELYEYEQERNEYRLPQVWVGQRRGPEVLKERIHKDDSVFHLIRRTNPLYIENAQDDPVLSGPYVVDREGKPADRFVVRERIQSTAVIPLKTGIETVGLMFASYRAPQTFTKGQKEVIELFANQAAIAINNSRLFSRSLRQRDELQVLNDIGQELTSGIRLAEKQVLELIHEQAGKLMPMDNMYIALYEEQTDTVRFGLAMQEGERLPDEWFQPNSNSGWTPRSGGAGRTEEIIRTKKPIFHRTWAEGEAWYAQAGHWEYIGHVSGSWIGVPMLVGDKVVGVIAAHDPRSEEVYDESDLQILMTLASQAAIALDNANLFYDVNQSLERRVKALAVLNEVGRALTSGIRLAEKQVLELIHEQAGKLIPMDNMYIALYEEQTDTVRFGLAMQEGERLPDEWFQPNSNSGWTPRSGGAGRTEEIIRTKQPIFHRTSAEGEAWYAQAGHKEYIGAYLGTWIGVPMVVGDKVVGVIAAYDPRSEEVYDESDLQILTTLASQAAIALENVNLYARLERRIDQIQTVQEITSAIRTYDELPELLRSILDVSLPHLNAQAGTIQLLDRTTAELVVRAVVGPADRKRHERISIDQGVTGQAARDRRSIYVPDTGQDKRFIDYLGQMRSEYAIPLRAGEEVIGVFNIEDPQPDAFDEETRELAALIADQAAIVMQNTLQYAKARDELIATKQVATLGTATAALQHRINNTLNIILPNVDRLRRRVDLSDETIQQIFDIIERNARNTSEYINRIQEPLKETKLQAVDINASLRDALAQVQNQYQGRASWRPVEVFQTLDNSLPLIEASVGQITEIFCNLIENGYKAMGLDGGTLTIISRRVGDWLEVEIRDTGPGIPTEILDRLFTKPVPSKQPGQAGPGSGLGLWLSALLLQRYSGVIRVDYTGPDGTTMLVKLPTSSSWAPV